jgi:hypothetical protein
VRSVVVTRPERLLVNGLPTDGVWPIRTSVLRFGTIGVGIDAPGIEIQRARLVHPFCFRSVLGDWVQPELVQPVRLGFPLLGLVGQRIRTSTLIRRNQPQTNHRFVGDRPGHGQLFAELLPPFQFGLLTKKTWFLSRSETSTR